MAGKSTKGKIASKTSKKAVSKSATAAKKPVKPPFKAFPRAPRKPKEIKAEPPPVYAPVVSDEPKCLVPFEQIQVNIRDRNKVDGPISLYPDRAPWDMHPWETGPSYNVFCIFMRMGPNRSVSKAVWESWPEDKKIAYEAALPREAKSANSKQDENTKPATPNHPRTMIPGGNARFMELHCTTANGWNSRFMWQARALAWDNHLNTLENKKLVDARREAAMRQADIGKRLQLLGERQVGRWEENANARFSVKDTLAIIGEGAKLEKAGLGLDDETAAKIGIQNNISFDLSGLSMDELLNLKKLRNRVTGQGNVIEIKG